MIELQRQILLPPYGAGAPGHAHGGNGRGAAPGLPVPVVWPVPPAPPQDGRDETSLAERRRPTAAKAEDAGDRTGEGAEPTAAAAGRADWRGRAPAAARFASRPALLDGAMAGPAGSIAFLAQQIFQEAMQTGLHLEPWAEGIGAYRRAGAEPPLESAAPAVLSLAI